MPVQRRRQVPIMSQKRWDTVGEVGVDRLFPEMAPRQPGPTSGLKVRFTNDRGRCDRSGEFANSVWSFLIHSSTETVEDDLDLPFRIAQCQTRSLCERRERKRL
jgi:hypothetical protein